jgi:hypothetical protein
MKVEEIDEVLSVLLDVPTYIKQVTCMPESRLTRILVSLKIIKPRVYTLELNNVKLGTNYRLSALANAMVRLKYDPLASRSENMSIIVGVIRKNTYALAAYIATAVQNNHKPAPENLVHAIAEQFTNEELLLTVREIYKRQDLSVVLDALKIPKNGIRYSGPEYLKSPWGILGSLMRYWRITTIKEALDQDYINAMVLNACIPSYDDKDKDTGNGGTMDFFEFGKQLAGIK